MTAANCPRCDDTGSLSRTDVLDCTYCGVAGERAALNDWAKKNIIGFRSASDIFWLAYQHGKAAATVAVDDEMTALLDFAGDISAQTPEKPDYWSSCGQCESNIGRASEILESICTRVVTQPPAAVANATVELNIDLSRSVQHYEESCGEGGGVYKCDTGPFVRMDDVINALVAAGIKP